jgi:hypothetical protein
MPGLDLKRPINCSLVISSSISASRTNFNKTSDLSIFRILSSDEFLSALTKIEKRQSVTKVKGKIASANTEQEQRKVMESIQKNKS